MVQKVDFPKFVGGLIKNVFQAIVESSIEQMRAYGELIANVAKTTDQFMRDNIGEAAGRDLSGGRLSRRALGRHAGGTVGRHSPRARTTEQPPPRLEARGDDAAVRLAEISRDLNLNPPVSRHHRRQCRAAPGHRGAAADGQIAPAAAVVDGDARHQPHRHHRRLDQRQGGVRHARQRHRQAQLHRLDARPRGAEIQGERQGRIRQLVFAGLRIGIVRGTSRSMSPPSAPRSTRPASPRPRSRPSSRATSASTSRATICRSTRWRRRR